ncbi:MAG: Gfo/Idh/MocA family oxidoreductase [Elusimicrobia bacterium]|nr:Gfo/Idh/MocA family oxidoreductase [Elusimicrobiota bacterium]
MTKLKGALVGFGQTAEKAHVPAYKRAPDFIIEAIVDEHPERLELARAALPGARCYASIEQLFQKETGLDFVDIATPPALHARHITLSLQHRCHVLCEKPLALHPKNFDSIRALCLSENRVVFCVHNWKYAPIFLKAAEMARAGAIGAVRHAEFHTLRRAPASDAGGPTWRLDPIVSGGGILIDHGWHNFYLLQALMEGPAKTISAHLILPESTGVEEEALCIVQYPRATALLYLTWRAHRRSNWGVLHGSAGTLELRDNLLVHAANDGATTQIDFREKLSESSAHPQWFQTMLDTFRDEIRRPEKNHQNLQEAEACLNMLIHAYESHRSGGKRITLPLPAPVLYAKSSRAPAGRLRPPANSAAAAQERTAG